MTADMHIHTLASDGLLTCQSALSEALSAGLGLLVVTDHDTIFNSKKAVEVFGKGGLKSVTGVEISAYVGDVKIHTLGYGFNPDDAALKAFFARLREDSFARTEDILSKLKACGVEIPFKEVLATRLSDETPVHVMHVCRAAVERGYAKDVNAFFYRYVMYGAPAFSNICRPTPEEAIDAVVSAGGIPVIAHPGRVDMDKESLLKLITHLSEVGLAGIEAVYSAHTVAETEYYKELAKELGLFVTGGSDTHFTGGNRKIGTPRFTPSDALLQRLGIE